MLTCVHPYMTKLMLRAFGHWTPVTGRHLNKLRCSAPCLSWPDPDGIFVLDNDASDRTIGAVLSQVQEGSTTWILSIGLAKSILMQTVRAVWDVIHKCDCYNAGARVQDLPCSAIVRTHVQWGRFNEDEDDVVPLANKVIPVCGSSTGRESGHAGRWKNRARRLQLGSRKLSNWSTLAAGSGSRFVSYH